MVLAADGGGCHVRFQQRSCPLRYGAALPLRSMTERAYGGDRRLHVGGSSSRASSPSTTGGRDRERIEDATRSFPPDQLGVSTHGGFAWVVFGNPITEDDEERTFRLVAEIAAAVRG